MKSVSWLVQRTARMLHIPSSIFFYFSLCSERIPVSSVSCTLYTSYYQWISYSSKKTKWKISLSVFFFFFELFRDLGVFWFFWVLFVWIWRGLWMLNLPSSSSCRMRVTLILWLKSSLSSLKTLKRFSMISPELCEDPFTVFFFFFLFLFWKQRDDEEFEKPLIIFILWGSKFWKGIHLYGVKNTLFRNCLLYKFYFFLRNKTRKLKWLQN